MFGQSGKREFVNSSTFDFNPLMFGWNILKMFLPFVGLDVFVSFSKLCTLFTIKNHCLLC